MVDNQIYERQFSQYRLYSKTNGYVYTGLNVTRSKAKDTAPARRFLRLHTYDPS